jgi:hypothetical protein
MNLAKIVLFISALAFAGAVLAQDESVAILKNVSGTVKVVRGETTIEGSHGMGLMKADRIVSEAAASGGIVFKDGTLLTVGPSTEIAIRDYIFEPKESKFAFSVYMTKGTAIYSSGKIGKLAPESVKLDTPRATVGVRGTRFIVAVE